VYLFIKSHLLNQSTDQYRLTEYLTALVKTALTICQADFKKLAATIDTGKASTSKTSV
jgi:hypothetical protein